MSLNPSSIQPMEGVLQSGEPVPGKRKSANAEGRTYKILTPQELEENQNERAKTRNKIRSAYEKKTINV